jgi:hypothetical protein
MHKPLHYPRHDVTIASFGPLRRYAVSAAVGSALDSLSAVTAAISFLWAGTAARKNNAVGRMLLCLGVCCHNASCQCLDGRRSDHGHAYFDQNHQM